MPIKLTDDQETQLCARYKTDEPVKKIKADFMIENDQLYELLLRHNVPLRSPARSHHYHTKADKPAGPTAPVQAQQNQRPPLPPWDNTWAPSVMIEWLDTYREVLKHDTTNSQ